MLVLGDPTTAAAATTTRPRPRSESTIQLVFLRAETESNNRGERRLLCQDRQSVRIRRSASGSDPRAQTAPGPRPLSLPSTETVRHPFAAPLLLYPSGTEIDKTRHTNHNIEHKPVTHVVWRGIRSREAPSG